MSGPLTGIRVVDLLNREVLKEKLRENLAAKNKLISKVYEQEEIDVEAIIREYEEFDKAIAEFSACYADHSERDHENLVQAAREGKLEVFVEEE